MTRAPAAAAVTIVNLILVLVVAVAVHAVVAPETAARWRRRDGHDGGRRPSPDGGRLTPAVTVTITVSLPATVTAVPVADLALVWYSPPSSSIPAGRKVCNGTHCFVLFWRSAGVRRLAGVWRLTFDVWCQSCVVQDPLVVTLLLQLV